MVIEMQHNHRISPKVSGSRETIDGAIAYDVAALNFNEEVNVGDIVLVDNRNGLPEHQELVTWRGRNYVRTICWLKRNVIEEVVYRITGTFIGDIELVDHYESGSQEFDIHSQKLRAANISFSEQTL